MTHFLCRISNVEVYTILRLSYSHIPKSYLVVDPHPYLHIIQQKNENHILQDRFFFDNFRLVKKYIDRPAPAWEWK